MSRVLYFDCFSGISGDMALGAFLDAGLPFAELTRALGTLALGDCHVHAKKVLRTGVSATKFSVHEHSHDRATAHSHEHAAPATSHQASHQHAAPSTQHGTQHQAPGTQHLHSHRSLPAIFSLIEQSALSVSARDRAMAMFQRLAEAEASIHQMAVEEVHLHEVGALDSIIDIVGIAFAMEWAAADRVVCSPLNVGGGMVQSAHGLFPVPAPATVKLLGSAPIYSGAVQKELVTPTGALIVSTYASTFGPVPAMAIESVGYGAGDRDDPTTPNVLRLFIGQEAERSSGERVTVIECEIDDMNPQIFGHLMHALYAAGALEVFYTPIQMKKNRPGTLLSVVTSPRQRTHMTDIIFRETTTIGLRHSEVDRECLERTFVTVDTPVGAVRIKIASRGGRVMNAVPEFEDCAALAGAAGLSVKEVQALAVQAYRTAAGTRA